MIRLRSLKKFFGIGPVGIMISLALLLTALRLDRLLGHVAILTDPAPLRAAGAALAVCVLLLIFWSSWTLRSWWKNGELCTAGPFRWFRHPIYAGWISFLFPAAALCLNSWLLLIAAALLHPVWHLLVRSEENMMSRKFQERYHDYMARTGRFFPKICC